RVDLDLAARVGGDEPDHELAREGPVLAPDVGDVLHVHADLFLHLPGDGALERLAIVDEAGDERIAAGRPDALAREQHTVAVAHDDDDRRVQVRVMLVLAARAALAPLAREALGASAARAASTSITLTCTRRSSSSCATATVCCSRARASGRPAAMRSSPASSTMASRSRAPSPGR